MKFEQMDKNEVEEITVTHLVTVGFDEHGLHPNAKPQFLDVPLQIHVEKFEYYRQDPRVLVTDEIGHPAGTNKKKL